MKIFEIITPTPKYLLSKHNQRLDRPKWRNKQKQRFQDETDDEGRHIPKSQISYKPNTIPLIRFGKFKQSSKIGLPADFRSEMGNAQYEAGVSCYKGSKWEDGWLVSEPFRDRAVYDMKEPFAPIFNFTEQLIRYLDHKIPMDIFLIFGHLSAFGRNNEYLNMGSDGEYLLDATKPYKIETLPPEKVYMPYGRQSLNFIQWIDIRFKYMGGIDGIRDEIEIRKIEMGK